MSAVLALLSAKVICLKLDDTVVTAEDSTKPSDLVGNESCCYWHFLVVDSWKSVISSCGAVDSPDA